MKSLDLLNAQSELFWFHLLKADSIRFMELTEASQICSRSQGEF